jgi:hypothetical protein
LPEPVAFTEEIHSAVLSLLQKIPWRGRNIRLLGIAVSKLTDKTSPGQVPLFPTNPRGEKAAQAVDEIRRRFGEAGITRASLLSRREVGEHRKPVTVVGNLWGANPGETVRLKGVWVRHTRYGDQFKVYEYESLLPASTAAIERYLASGLIKGIGPAYARRLVEAFGVQTSRGSARHTQGGWWRPSESRHCGSSRRSQSVC